MADEADRRGETLGACGECGLGIEWARLRLEAVAKPWLVEATASRQHIARRAFATLLRTTRPFRFWESIDLALPLSRRRLVVFLIAVLAALHFLASTQRMLVGPKLPWGPPPPPSVQRAMTIGHVSFALMMPLSEYDGSDVVDKIWRMSGETDTIALVVNAAPTMLKCAIPFRQGLVVASMQVPPGIVVSDPVVPDAATLVTPAAEKLALVFIPATLVAPLALLLLPTSLRRARVRPRHFVRLMGYTTALVVPIVGCAYLADQFNRVFLFNAHFYTQIHLYPFGAFGEVNSTLAFVLLALVLNAVWLTAAASRYLRLPNPRGVGVACALIPMLVACLVLLRW
jgi:hypothetical protein